MSAEPPLLSVLHQEIRTAGGRISFARFAELCLYHPQRGYYNTDRVKLGARGDFYTSGQAVPVFARLLAGYFERLWQELGQPARFDFVELGPGDGCFAAELLPWIVRRFPEFSSCLHYIAVEQSPVLRARLQEKLASLGARVRILETFPAVNSETSPFTGCVFANEFFDSLPFHILVRRAGQWLERYVGLEGDRLAWREENPSAAALVPQAQRLFASRRSEDRLSARIAELRPAAGQWMRAIAGSLARGEVLIVDYGYLTEEWHAGRFPEGSALAYRKHGVIDDLLASPGEQDLTAHVNFSQLMEVAEQSGLRQTTPLPQPQSRFLLALAERDQLQDAFADCASEAERQERARLFKTLVLPQGLGETFRVLQWRKRM
jgi:SAM-dependent MidA family methyltransferase